MDKYRFKEIVMLKNSRPGGKKGFTLIELMVVVAILGVLGLVVATNIFPAIGKTKQTVARSNIEALKGAVQTYKLANNKIPETLDQLTEPDPKNMDEPYLEDADLLFDPWDFPYQYLVESRSKFEIKSLGADGLEGGEGEDADISSKDSRRDTE
jgi:general secretion pathway protein G